MKTTDTSEKALESLIVKSLVDNGGYLEGKSQDFDRAHAIDLAQLQAFLENSQPKIADKIKLQQDSISRTQFLHRLQNEITKRGVIDVMRNGIKHAAEHIHLFYSSPTRGNEQAKKLFQSNRFSITRQLHYSSQQANNALDMVIFVNGLPIMSFELKNRLTKQTIHDAVRQYQNDRDPKELLFQFGRCIAHFALDDHEVRFCTHLQGKHSWFLPFNQGHNDGAGNPPNPNGISTAYFWENILAKPSLVNILEKYAQVVEEKNEKNNKKRRKQIFPRFHQLHVVRQLLADLAQNGAGKRYLIQHSAGSGKSNSIAWLAHQLVGLEYQNQVLFDSVIVVTDRRILDQQICNTIKQFMQLRTSVGHAEKSGDLRQFLHEGKKIIITTVQKFPFILDEIGNEYRQRQFAIIIDEAHSSQGGKTAAAMNQALNITTLQDDDTEDKINQLMEARKMASNASYFAFTATPKNKTLEIFGTPQPQTDGKTKFQPFHSYTMKQAIQEGFILDVLTHYITVKSYYHLAKIIEDDPLFDRKKSKKKLRRYVESHAHAIGEKAKIMIDHFHTQVIGQQKIGGQARAMIITNGIDRAIAYFYAFKTYLKQRKSPYQAIVAFSGEYNDDGKTLTEASLNGFSGGQIPEKIQQDPYRFLIVADKFLTGYDEPLLHTMYVDKPLAGVKAVQTLSRLNRAHPKKHDTCILDFYNDADTIQQSFEPYYRTTLLSDQTDPNKLHDLKATLDSAEVYDDAQIERFVTLYLNDAARDTLDPILNACVQNYLELDEDGQVDFKSKAKSFVRLYGFLAAILPFSNSEWEKLSIFLNFLIPKLPTPKEEDLSRGILETIDMDSYRAELQASLQIELADADAEIAPIPASSNMLSDDADLNPLSNILQAFNDQFGNIEWNDADKIRQAITEDIPNKVAADEAYQNAMQNNDEQNARREHDAALQRVLFELLSDYAELFKQFSDNESFKTWLGDTIFKMTYQKSSKAHEHY